MIAALNRIPCCIPFCRRTASQERNPESSQIICGKCWRRISMATRARYRQLARRQRRLLARFEREVVAHEQGRSYMTPERQDQWEMIRQRLFDLMDRNWAQCRREAVERHGGIA